MNKKVPVVTKKVTKKPVKLNELQVESIAHYKRMIKWVKTQPATDKKREYIMEASINENWHGENCAYCEKHETSAANKINTTKLLRGVWPLNSKCDTCPLHSHDVPFDDYENERDCCNGLWQEMHESKTWKEWLVYANKIVKYIKENG